MYLNWIHIIAKKGHDQKEKKFDSLLIFPL